MASSPESLRQERTHPRATDPKREEAFSRHIERIIGVAPTLSGRKREIMESRMVHLSAEQKAIKIFELLMAQTLAHPDPEQGLNESGRVRLALLWNDTAAREIFLRKSLEAKYDTHTLERADIYRDATDLTSRIAREREELVVLEQGLNLGGGSRESKEEEAADLALAVETDAQALADFKTLEGRVHTPENTDALALLHYDQLREYRRQNEEDRFVWFDSRTQLLVEIKAYQAQGKMAHLMGPAGTGKTTLFRAVVRDMTGGPMITIPCAPNVSEEGLMYHQDLKNGEGAKDFSGLIAEALTGYLNSQDATPSDKARLGVLLDEADRLNPDKAKAVIKFIQGLKEGDDLYGKLVRRGWVIGAASNKPIEEEALRREFAKVPVDYIKMTPDQPELYEYMLINLMREKGHMPALATSLIAPAYDAGVLTEPERTEDGTLIKAKPRILPIDHLREVTDGDGAVVSREQTINKQHGFLYRLAFAIRAVQDAYMHGSKFNEKHMANTALYKTTEHIDGRDVERVSGYISALDGREPDKAYSGSGTHLTLNVESTITATLVERWMKGWDGQSDFVAYIQSELERHIHQTASDDKLRLRAIFEYFHLLGEGNAGQEHQRSRADSAVLVPKDIGYLSPRVPRPWDVEYPEVSKAAASDKDAADARESAVAEEKKTFNVTLEDGVDIEITAVPITVLEGEQIAPGKRLVLRGEALLFVGVTADGKPVVQVTESELHRVLDVTEELPRAFLEQAEHESTSEIATLTGVMARFWEWKDPEAENGKSCLEETRQSWDEILAEAKKN